MTAWDFSNEDIDLIWENMEIQKEKILQVSAIEKVCDKEMEIETKYK